MNYHFVIDILFQLTRIGKEKIFLYFSDVTRQNFESRSIRCVWAASEISFERNGIRCAYVSDGPWRMKNSAKPIDRSRRDSFLSLLVLFISHTACFLILPRGPGPVFLLTARKWNLAVVCRHTVKRSSLLMQFLQKQYALIKVS